MLELLIALTIVEAVLVLGVLVYYLIRLRISLRNTAGLLGKTAFGVRAIEQQAKAIGPSVVRINAALEELATAGPELVAAAERLPTVEETR